MTESDPSAPRRTQLVVRPAFASGVMGTAGLLPPSPGIPFFPRCKKTMMRRPA